MIESYQKQKKVFLSIAVTGVSLLILSVCLRTIPPLDDAISRKPQYMRWIADRVARSIAARYGNEAAVIVTRDEKADCRQINDANVPNPDDLYYIVSYSESTHSLCFVTYANLPKGWGQANSVLLYPNIGRNYGQKLNVPVRAVALSQFQMVYPLAYLSLLHWRAKIDSSSFKRAANAKFEQWLSSSSQPSDSLNVEIDFPSLRADVGRRQKLLNQVLIAAMLASTLLIAFAGYRAWTSYRQFGAFLARYRYLVSFAAYLRRDLGAIASRARHAYQDEQRRAVEQARAVIIEKRSREAIRRRLESVLTTLPDGQTRTRVTESLARDNLSEMKAVIQEMEGQVGQRSPEEKLTALLDSLKQYCSEEELDGFCAQAFQILAASGFRDARGFVVSTHDQLRARLKELEDEHQQEFSVFLFDSPQQPPKIREKPRAVAGASPGNLIRCFALRQILKFWRSLAIVKEACTSALRAPAPSSPAFLLRELCGRSRRSRYSSAADPCASRMSPCERFFSLRNARKRSQITMRLLPPMPIRGPHSIMTHCGRGVFALPIRAVRRLALTSTE